MLNMLTCASLEVEQASWSASVRYMSGWMESLGTDPGTPWEIIPKIIGDIVSM